MPLPEPTYRNSAGRLLAILSAYPNDKQVIEFLPGLMPGVSENVRLRNKQQICFVALREIEELYQQFLDDMANLQIPDLQRQVMLSNLAKVQQTVYPMALNNTIRVLNDAEKQMLEVCETMIPQEDTLEKEDIDAIRESIALLRELVEHGDVSSTLKKTLLELIRLAEDAISRFNIHGARGLKRAFKTMLSEAIDFYYSEGIQEREELKKTGVWQKMMNLVHTMDTVAGKILKYQPWLEKIPQIAQFLIEGPR